MLLKDKKILVADDEPDIREALKEVLGAEGAQIFVAEDGSRALYMIETMPFDAVITDLKMPKLNGIQLVSEIKSKKNFQNVPIFVMSAYLDDATLKKVTSMGIATAITKPIDLRSLIEKLLAKVGTKSKPLSYDVRVVNCFIDGVEEVMKFYLGPMLELGAALVKKDQVSRGYVTGLISFSGTNLMGSISVTFDEHFLNILVKKIFEGNVQIDNNLICDLAGEACNQVLGKAKINLEKLSLKLQIGLPRVVIGKDHSIHHSVKNPVILIPVSAGEAKCFVEFTMTELAEEQINELASNQNKPNQSGPTPGVW